MAHAIAGDHNGDYGIGGSFQTTPSGWASWACPVRGPYALACGALAPLVARMSAVAVLDGTVPSGRSAGCGRRGNR